MIHLRTAFVSAVLLLLQTSAHAETACGSKEAKDLIEDPVLNGGRSLSKDYLANAAENLLAEKVLTDASYRRRVRELDHKLEPRDFKRMTKVLVDSAYDVDLLDTFQTGQAYSTISCEGTLKLTATDGAWANLPIRYKVVVTDDGKTIVHWGQNERATVILFGRVIYEEVLDEARDPRSGEAAEPSEKPSDEQPGVPGEPAASDPVNQLEDCSSIFDEKWNSWNAWNQKGPMPKPEHACTMRKPNGGGDYLCNDDGCSRQ